MGRLALPPGSWGSISVRNVGPSKYKARARFADADGTVRTIARFAQTEGRARNELRAALAERAQRGRIDRGTTVRQIAALYLASLERRDLAARTVEHYHYIVERRINRAPIGKLRVADATTRVCDLALQAVAEISPAEAKTTRTLLNGMFRLAVAHGAIAINPIREVGPISTRKGKKAPRALTVEQAEDLTDLLRTDERAVLLDLPDLVDFMLRTGCRIGEALAVREECIDLTPTLDAPNGAVAVNRTVVRLKGQGLRLDRPKTPMSNRVLALPPALRDMIERRRGELRFRTPEGALFPSPMRPTLRDPSNTLADLREVFDRIGCPDCGGRGWHAALKTAKQNEHPAGVLCEGDPPFAWLVSHVFRKTVATRFDEAGLPPRVAADQLGHADPGFTQRVYFGRGLATPDAARILDR